LDAADRLADKGISAEVIDLRVLNPFDPEAVVEFVRKTGHLLAIDGGWRTCGMAGEVIAAVAERGVSARMRRITLPDAPAPSSRMLEKAYYPTVDTIVATASRLLS
jgi:pyruvate dehydrogenase E1 component beta subunit